MRGTQETPGTPGTREIQGDVGTHRAREAPGAGEASWGGEKADGRGAKRGVPLAGGESEGHPTVPALGG